MPVLHMQIMRNVFGDLSVSILKMKKNAKCFPLWI